MYIRKISASSLNTAELCLSRWQADRNAGRDAQISGRAAQIGTCYHLTLQNFFEMVVMGPSSPKHNPSLSQSIETLEMLFMGAYMDTYESADTDTPEYTEGWDLVQKWYARTNLEGFTVLACEAYESFPVPTAYPVEYKGEVLTGEINGKVLPAIPCNFIIDRLDRWDSQGPGVYRVVDYKTLQKAINPEQLKKKIQARIYGLAVQIMYPDAERVWVQFDMIRHNDSVGTFFTRAENIETWKFLKRAIKRIQDQPEGTEPDPKEPGKTLPGPKETLNEDCGWCIKKTTCNAFLSNAGAGGVYSFESLQQMVDRAALLRMKAKGAYAAAKEIEKQIVQKMEEEERTDFETENNVAVVKVKKERAIDAQEAHRAMGDEWWAIYGGSSITIANYDKLMKNKDVPEEVKSKLKRLLRFDYGEPYIDTKPKGVFD